MNCQHVLQRKHIHKKEETNLELHVTRARVTDYQQSPPKGLMFPLVSQVTVPGYMRSELPPKYV